MEDLKRLAKIANREAFRECGHRSTCILTSAALYHAICELGWGVRPVRLRASVYSIDPNNRHGCVLGSDGGGERLPKASKDCWWGHLGVVVHERFLIDATIDQVAEGHDWAAEIPPFVGEIPDGFLEDGKSLFVPKHGDVNIWYSMFYRQNGWKGAPDWRNKYHWWFLTQKILKAYQRSQKVVVSKRAAV